MQEIVGALYTDNDFYRAIDNSLHHDGAIVAQIGEANYLQDAPSMFSVDRNCDGFVDGLEAMNFTEMTEYQEVSSTKLSHTESRKKKGKARLSKANLYDLLTRKSFYSVLLP